MSLTVETGGNNTYYLYGLGAIGEKTTALRQAQDSAWNYSLPDGTNRPLSSLLPKWVLRKELGGLRDPLIISTIPA